VADRIEVALGLRDEAEFYQPQFMDFRGRLYPRNVAWNNQADHWAKGLAEFRDGAPLGTGGLDALACHTANCWGQDKLQLEQRIKWCVTNLDMLREVASSYERASEELVAADEPLAAYAATLDLVAAVDAPVPSEYVSRIPCAVDGTCNGLQILSLLGHDPVGAQKTNCTAFEQRQDIYMEVADIALDIVRGDCSSSEVLTLVDSEDSEVEFAKSDLADVWYEYLCDSSKRRKAVKRAIMTTAYGVSNNTIKDNLVQDGIVNGLKPGEHFDSIPTGRLNYVLAAYFRDVIVEARSGAIQAAVQIMDYLKDVAAALGAEGHDLEWTTPDGSWHRQSYRKTEETRVVTPELGRLVLRRVTPEIDARKQGSGAAPNVVHSLDAAMLRSVAVRMAEAGVTELAFIHDSYGASAGNIDLLSRILREVAVEMFQGNWLADFHQEQLEKGVVLPEPPAQGDLDVAAEIPKAKYFFS
jgi:DNA-directed RNA polymerase